MLLFFGKGNKKAVHRKIKAHFIYLLTIIILHQARHKLLRKYDILHINGIRKERGNLLIAKSCYTATYSCNQEREPVVLLCKTDERIYVGLDGFHTTLHGRDGVCLTMQTNTFAPYGAKPFVSQPCCTATMFASQFA